MFNWIADVFIYEILSLEAGEKLALVLHFFIYDILKILSLIFLVVSLISLIRTYISPNKLKNIMQKSRFGFGNLAASTFGAVTPFCSCSSIPIFIGFLKAKIPIGIAFSYLITSPLVNEVAFVIMGGLFGWRLAILYAVSGILLGVIAGMILGSLKMENNIILDSNVKNLDDMHVPKHFKGKVKYALNDGKRTFKKLYLYVLGGVALGAIIHGYVPQEFFENYICIQ